jgi:hypothetical protein
MNTRQSSNKQYTLTLRYTDSNMPKMYYHSDDRNQVEIQGSCWINQFGPSVKTLTVLDRSDGSTAYYNGQGTYLFTLQPEAASA